MRTSGFVCKQCGNCCLKLYDAYQPFGIHNQILICGETMPETIYWLGLIPTELGNEVYVYDLWINPKTGRIAAMLRGARG